MKNIVGLASGLSTEVDIVPVTITPPTVARTHSIASSSAKDNNDSQFQVETAVVVGAITTAGNATVTVTSAGMSGSPKAVSVAVVDGTAQIETATAVGTVTGDGNAEIIVTGDLVTGSPLTVPVAVSAGTAQVETATIVGVMATAGDIDIIMTGAELAGSPLTVGVTVDAGVAQVNTATIVGTIGAAGAGNIDVIVTGTDIAGSPLTVPVAVANDDTASDVGGKVRAALGVAAITGSYAVSGATTDIILTGKSLLADDATLNIAYENGTATGLTEDATSVKTTAGSTPDDASAVATKVIAELNSTAAVTDDYTVGGTGADVSLTAAIAANDATLNIAYENGTATGLTEDATSANTVAGVVADDADAVATLIRAALGIAAITDDYTVSGATDAIILTADAKAANDTTLNISIANGTATGLTEDLTSADTAAGVAIDVNALIAAKLRTAMLADAVIGHPTTGKFTVTVDDNDLIFTANVAAVNDATLNIAVEDGTSVGITDDTSSNATTEGSAAGGAGKVVVEGIGDGYVELSETVELSGSTGVDTVNDYLFINDMYVDDTTANVGVITATAAVDATASCTISAAAGESQQAFYMTPLVGTSKSVTNLDLDTVNATGNAITTFRLKIKDAFGSWKTKRVIKLIDSDVKSPIPMAILLPPRSLVKVTAAASAGTSSVGVYMTIE